MKSYVLEKSQTKPLACLNNKFGPSFSQNQLLVCHQYDVKHVVASISSQSVL